MAINPISIPLAEGLLEADFSPGSPEARARSRYLGLMGGLLAEPMAPSYSPTFASHPSGWPTASEYKYAKESPYHIDTPLLDAEGVPTLPTVTTVPGSEGGGLRWTDPSSVPTGPDGVVPDISMSTLPDGTVVISHETGEEVDIPRDDETGKAVYVTEAEVRPGYIRLDDGSVVPDTSASTPTTRDAPGEKPFLYFPDYSAYVDKYPDLAAHYAAGGGGGRSKEEWGKLHYDSYGAGEGREPPTYKLSL
jgi:hypothetical protein